MFKKTRIYLTITFTAILIGFLASFNIACYLLLSNSMMNMSEEEIQTFADNELQEHAYELLNHTELNEQHDDEDHDTPVENNKSLEFSLLPFYIVIDENHQQVAGNFPKNLSLEIVEKKLQKWSPKTDEEKYLTLETTNDQKLYFIFAKRIIFDANGHYVGAIIAGADVSQQQITLHRFLMISLAMSTVFLVLATFAGYLMSKRAMRPIMQAFAKQRQFISDASHELRTPLSVIYSSVEVIEAEEAEQLAPYSKQLLVDVKDEVQRLTSMTQDLLLLAQIDANTVKLHLEVIDVGAELEMLVRKLQPLAANKKISINFHCAHAITAHVDRNRFCQLMIILIDNAIQYTGEQGWINVSVTEQAKTLHIHVQDSGIGIAKEQLETIFERFYRADPARSRANGNAGLGLSIAHWIATAHHGSLTVHSELGHGSTFTFIIPK